MPRVRYGIFCEDIREESGNKVSVLGIFAGVCLVPKLPTTMRGLAFHAFIENPEGVELRVRFEVSGPIGDGHAASPTGEAQPFFLAETAVLPGDKNKNGTNFNIVFGPTALASAGHVKVRLAMPDAQPSVDETFVLEIREGTPL